MIKKRYPVILSVAVVSVLLGSLVYMALADRAREATEIEMRARIAFRAKSVKTAHRC